MIYSYKKIITICLATCLIALVAILFFVGNDITGSFDSLDHLSLVKKISSEENFVHDSYFWGNIRSVYPPLLYSLTVVVQKVTGTEDYVVLANLMSAVIFMMYVAIIFLIGKKIFESNILGITVVLISLCTYYVGRRFSLFLPENLSIVMFLSYVYVVFISDFQWVRRIGIGGMLMGCVLLTNVLTSSMAISVMLLTIPILLWKKKYALLLTISASLVIAAVMSYYTIIVINGDLFWMNYIKIPLVLSFCASVTVLVFDTLQALFQISRRQSLAVCIAGLTIITILFYTPLLHFVTGEQYWSYDQFGQKFEQNITRYFFDNGASRLGMNPVVAIMGLFSLVAMLFTKRLFDSRLLPFVVAVLLSLFIVLVGPYFGIEPSNNAPRAMLYISVFIPVIAVYVLHTLSNNRLFRVGLPVVVGALLITSIPNIIRFTDTTIAKPTQTLIDYVSAHVGPRDIFISHPVTFNSVYVLGGGDLTHLFYTPFSNTQFSNTKNQEKIMEYETVYVIDGPYGKFSQFITAGEKRVVVSEAGYTLFAVSRQ